MTRENFANFLLFTFANDTVDPNRNKTLKKMQAALNKNPKFYQNIPNNDYLNIFRNQVQMEQIDADENVIASKSFWNQPNDESFKYVLRALPLIKKHYKEAYKEIVNEQGEIVLPAGLDSINQPNKKTIYNLVNSYDAKDDKDDIDITSNLSKNFQKLSK